MAWSGIYFHYSAVNVHNSKIRHVCERHVDIGQFVFSQWNFQFYSL